MFEQHKPRGRRAARSVADTSPGAARWRRACLVLFWLCLTPGTATAGAAVTFVLSSDASHYRVVSEGLKERLRAAHPRVETATRLMGEDLPPATGELFVTLGSRATLEFLAAHPGVPQLGLFVTESAWDQSTAVDELAGDAPKAVIFVDQPVARYIMLAAALAPEARTLGVALGPVSGQYRDDLQAEAKRRGKALVVADLPPDGNPLRVLTPLIHSSDLFLAVPDQNLFNRNIARWALQLAFKRRIPIIGFSRSYTRAGAVASVFTSPADIIHQAGAWLENYFSPAPPAWGARPPEAFSLHFNRSVATALGIDAERLDDVHQRMKTMVREASSP